MGIQIQHVLEKVRERSNCEIAFQKIRISSPEICVDRKQRLFFCGNFSRGMMQEPKPPRTTTHQAAGINTTQNAFNTIYPALDSRIIFATNFDLSNSP